MEALFRAESYDVSLLSLPFAAASVVALGCAIYLVITDGAPLLRGSLMLVVTGILVYVVGGALAASTVDPEAVVLVFRLSNCLLPLSAAGVLMFLLALSGRLPRYRWLVALSMVSGLVSAVFTVGTDLVIRDVWMTPSGMYWFRIPPNGLGQLQPALLTIWVAVSGVLTWRHLRVERSEVRRRQLRGALWAFGVSMLGMADLSLAYEVGWYPVSGVFLIIGASMALRLLVVDDLVHARALDRRAPLVLLYMVAAFAGVWLVARAAGPTASAAAIALFTAVLFAVLRVLVGLAQAIEEPASARHNTPLDRALDRYTRTVSALHERAAIAEATIEVVELGVGAERVELLSPSRDDYSWETSSGEVLAEARTPDPLLLVWLEQNARPLARDDLATMRLGELREPIERLFEAHHAEVLVPLVNRDEVVGLLCLGALPGGRAYRQDEVQFLARLRDQAASALVYARMHADATERVEVDKDVGLAAAVQKGFVPGAGRLSHGGMLLAGTYQPASKCGGDWWSVHEQPNGSVLVLIGDVTGHGIAAAMVTAAAKGCYDVAQRLMGDRIDLVRLLDLLDASVKRAGARQFYMTCFATLIDRKAGRVRYANAGHVVPYLCHPSDEAMELDVLVARGDPLGAGGTTRYVEHERAIHDGDFLIWYTDGLVECSNPRREQFGDRRMQRMLRRLKPDTRDVVALRDHVLRAAVAFQEGQAADDDITLVVGRVGAR